MSIPSDAVLLDVLCCLASGAGLIPALLLAAAAFEIYASTFNVPRAADWAKVARSLLERLGALERAGGFAALRVPPNTDKPTPYSLLASAGRAALSPKARDAALVLLAVILFEACHRRARLRMKDVSAWALLWRADTSKRLAKDWRTVAKKPPTTIADIHVQLESAQSGSLRDLLQAAARAMALDVPAVVTEWPVDEAAKASVLGPGTERPDATMAADVKSEIARSADLSEAPSTRLAADGRRDGAPDSNEAGSRIKPEDLKNPVGWKLKQSLYSEYTQLFDLPCHRDRLAPFQMKQLFRALATTLNSGSEVDRDYVVIAHLSARAGLTLEILLDLPLGPAGSVWIDRERRCLAWDFNTALKGLDPSASMPSAPVLLRLEARVSARLASILARNPSAARLRDCFGLTAGALQQVVWIDAYRQFLQRHGDQDHRAYEARFAYSMGDVYRSVTGNESLAPLMALDFTSMPTSLLYYITFTAKYIDECERKVFEYLEWSPPQEPYPLPTVGATISISTTRFSQGWTALQQDAGSHRKAVEAATTAIELVDAFNALSNDRLASFMCLTGHRGTLLHRLVWRALFMHTGTAQLFDKDVGRHQSRRHVPVTRLLDQLRAAWREDFQLLARQAKRLGIALRAKGHRALAPGAAGEAFCHIRVTDRQGSPELERARSGKSRLTALFKKHFNAPINIARHFLVSELLMRGAGTWLIRALTGHYRRHAELHGDGMLHPPSLNVERLGAALDTLVEDLALCPPGGFSNVSCVTILLPLEGPVPKPVPLRKPGQAAAAPMQVLPPAFDAWSPLALRFGDEARALLSRSAELDPSPDFLANLLWFGLFDLEDQASILNDWPNHRSPQAAVALASWSRDRSQQRITMPLNAACALARADVPIGEAIDTLAAMAVVGQWHRTHFPGLHWPKDSFDAYRVAVRLMLGWRRFNMSPALLTAGSMDMPSAAFDVQSVLRIADAPNASPEDDATLGLAVRAGPARHRGLHSDMLEAVADTLREVASRDEKLGRDPARAALWQEKLQRVVPNDDARAETLHALMMEEASLILTNSDEADKVTTLYGYLSEQLDALQLLEPSDNMAEFDPEEFKSWVAQAKAQIDDLRRDTVAVRLDEPRHFGLKRLLKVGARLGWQVPRRLWSDGGSRSAFDGYRASAASVAILGSDFDRMRQLLTRHFTEWPASQHDALLSLDLHMAVPLRSGARTSLPATAVFVRHPAMRIGTGAYNRDKQSRGDFIVSTPDDVHARLLDARKAQISASNSLLLTRSTESDPGHDRKITEALVSAGAQSTRNARFREQSLRGANAANRLWPDWESICRDVLQCHGTVQRCHEYMQSMMSRPTTGVVQAARDCGHSRSTITLDFYGGPWPLLWSVATQALLVGLKPSGERLRKKLGDTGSLRNARLAAKHRRQPFCTWHDAARRVVKSSDVPLLASDVEVATVVPRGDASGPAEARLADAALLVASRMVRNLSPRLADGLGIPGPLAQRLGAAVPGSDEVKVLVRRQRGAATPEQLEIDAKFLLEPDCRSLSEHLASRSSDAIDALLTDLRHGPDRRARRALVGSELAERLALHLVTLPQTLQLLCRVSAKYASPLEDEDILGLGDRFVLAEKPDPRIGPIPRLMVTTFEPGTDKEIADETEAVGRWTVAVRLLCSAVLISRRVFQGGSQ